MKTGKALFSKIGFQLPLTILLAFIFGCAPADTASDTSSLVSSPTNTGPVRDLPDLIIESVKLERIPVYSPVVSSGVDLAITLRIRNIGTVSVNQSFFIDVTRSKRDFDEGYYSLGERVRFETLVPGEMKETRMTSTVDSDLKRIRLLINTAKGLHPKGAPVIIEESDYTNNTFEMAIPDNIPLEQTAPAPPSPEIPINKYTSPNSYNLVSAQPLKYSFEELDGIIVSGDDVSPAARESCMNTVSDYIYAFPGYRYANISGEIKAGARNPDANITVTISARRLSELTEGTGPLFDEGGHSDVTLADPSETPDAGYDDSYSFQIAYDKDTQTCRLVSLETHLQIISKRLYYLAEVMAREHPVVKQFRTESEKTFIIYDRWFDDRKGDARDTQQIDFTEPVQGIVTLLVNDYGSNYLWVYVDVFHGEIFTRGPIYHPPD